MPIGQVVPCGRIVWIQVAALFPMFEGGAFLADVVQKAPVGQTRPRMLGWRSENHRRLLTGSKRWLMRARNVTIQSLPFPGRRALSVSIYPLPPEPCHLGHQFGTLFNRIVFAGMVMASRFFCERVVRAAG